MTEAQISPRRIRPTIVPRVLRRVEAAAYLGLSPGAFDKIVKDGIGPQPRMIAPNVFGFDIVDLDAFIETRPYRSTVPVEADDNGASELDRILGV